MKDLTIREYANIKGVSVQCIYKKLDNELKPYLKIKNNKRFLDGSILEQENEQGEEERQATAKTENEQIINILKSQNELLNEQIKVKDNQIENLNKRLEEMSKRLQEANLLNHNNQVLLLETHKNNKKGFWSFLKGNKQEEEPTQE